MLITILARMRSIISSSDRGGMYSSIADSRANSVCELPIERQNIMGTPVWTLVVSSLKIGQGVRAVDGAGGGHVVDAAFDQHVFQERQVC